MQLAEDELGADAALISTIQVIFSDRDGYVEDLLRRCGGVISAAATARARTAARLRSVACCGSVPSHDFERDEGDNRGHMLIERARAGEHRGDGFYGCFVVGDDGIDRWDGGRIMLVERCCV